MSIFSRNALKKCLEELQEQPLDELKTISGINRG